MKFNWLFSYWRTNEKSKSGERTVGELYSWIDQRVSISNSVELDQEIINTLHPLPAFHLLDDWSLRLDLHILSNHRTEWIVRCFGDKLKLFKTITISDSVGCCKPDPAIFSIVQSKLNSTDGIYYVDDHEKNLTVARTMGWGAILADPDGNWIQKWDQSFIGRDS